MLTSTQSIQYLNIWCLISRNALLKALREKLHCSHFHYMDLSKLCKPVFVMLLYMIYMYVFFSSEKKQAEFWLRFGSLWKPLLLPLNWIDPGCFKYQLFIVLVCFGHQFLVQQLTTGSQCRYSQILATLCNNVTEFWTKIVDWVTGYRCNFFAI